MEEKNKISIFLNKNGIPRYLSNKDIDNNECTDFTGFYDYFLKTNIYNFIDTCEMTSILLLKVEYAKYAIKVGFPVYCYKWSDKPFASCESYEYISHNPDIPSG